VGKITGGIALERSKEVRCSGADEMLQADEGSDLGNVSAAFRVQAPNGGVRHL